MMKAGKKDVIVYFANWYLGRKSAMEGAEVASIPWDKLTSVNHAFWQVAPADGTKETTFEWQKMGRAARTAFQVVPKDAFKDLEDMMPSEIHPEMPRNHFAEYAEYAKKYPNVTIMLSIGGWTRCGYFSEMAYTKEGRESCAASCVEILKQYPWLGGIDIDWEYPTGSNNASRLPGEDDNDYDEGCPVFGTPEEDKVNFAAFMEALRKALDDNFGKDAKKLTACSSGQIAGALANQDWAAAAPYLDVINIMTYDLVGVWDGYTGHTSSVAGALAAAEYLMGQGVPAEKLCIGAPLYGSSFRMKEIEAGKQLGVPAENKRPTNKSITEVELEALEEEGKKEVNGWHYVYDKQEEAPYLYNDDETSEYYKWFISYENSISLQAKLDCIKEKNFAGIIVWECSQDTKGYGMIGQMAENLIEE